MFITNRSLLFKTKTNMNSLAFENKKEVKKSITRKKLELRDFNAFKHGGSSSARVNTNDQVAIGVTSV